MELSLPPAIQQLSDTLEASGFSLVEEDYDHANFGNGFLLLTDGTLRVRLVRERGDWFIEVASTSFEKEWFSAMVWHAYLEGADGAMTTPSLEDQCRTISEDINRMHNAAVTDPSLLEHLKEHRARRARGRQGAI